MKIGDYVRTEWGIGKFIKDYKDSQGSFWKIIDGCINLDSYDEFSNFFCESEILKSSPNIIDLVQVGDYVNGILVVKKSKEYIYEYANNVDVIWFEDNTTLWLESNIKSIVTKEQFASMEYRIGDK